MKKLLLPAIALVSTLIVGCNKTEAPPPVKLEPVTPSVTAPAPVEQPTLALTPADAGTPATDATTAHPVEASGAATPSAETPGPAPAVSDAAPTPTSDPSGASQGQAQQAAQPGTTTK